MQAIIRPFPLYYKNKKVAEIASGSYDIAPGDEMQVGAEGVLGYSDGCTVTKIEADCIVPVKGLSVTIMSDMLAKKYVSVGIVVDGKSHQMDMRITHANYTWDSKSGKAMGKFSLEGGTPDVTG
jgi:hypothetical protein